MNSGSDPKRHRLQRPFLCGLCAVALVLLAGCGGQLVDRYPVASLDEIPEVQEPWVAFNFDPTVKPLKGESTYRDGGIYLYNIATQNTIDFHNNEVRISDCDTQKMLAIGLTETAVVEVDLETGTYQALGPAEYEGKKLVATSVRWIPNGVGYSAVTEDGQLILWKYGTEEFERLTRIEDREEYFDYVWIHDGQSICVPDEQGIAILDAESGELKHWLTLDITYPEYGSPAQPSGRKSFDVSADGRLVVYSCRAEFQEIRAIWLDDSGNVEREELLGRNSFENIGFAIAPNGKNIIIAMDDVKSTLFSPHYYEVWLFDGKQLIKLLETDDNSNGIELYW